MGNTDKTNEELLLEMQELRDKYEALNGEFQKKIDDRNYAEYFIQIRSRIFNILNESIPLSDAFHQIINTIKTEMEFDAVGIRLLEGEDFPYFVQKGFSSDFLLTENSLTVLDNTRSLCRDSNGLANLECTCGLVISGKTDPSNSLFTVGGSAWTNDSKEILAIPSDLDPRLHPRNNCIHSGYNSVALIPIRTSNGIVGLLQLNDRKYNRFNLEIINILEGICSNIGADLMRKQAELIKIKNLELADLNATKDKFFSIIAHDLRNPIGTFMQLTELIHDSYDDLNRDELIEFLHAMKKSSKNIFSLLENLLEWSRSQRGKIEFIPVKVDLSKLIHNIIDVVKLTADKKQISFHNLIPENFNVIADLNLLNTILRNLISNAIKFTQNSGSIVVGTVDKPSESTVEIYIKDNGIGMDSMMLSKLFKIDQNVSRLGTNKEPSTGLGLLLCKEFVEKHKGKIWVESEVGKGSTFYFNLQKAKK